MADEPATRGAVHGDYHRVPRVGPLAHSISDRLGDHRIGGGLQSFHSFAVAEEMCPARVADDDIGVRGDDSSAFATCHGLHS